MTTPDILEKVPADGRAVVTESGVKTGEEALFLRQSGADALLIGSAFIRAQDVRRAVDRMVNAG
jgi:indole-3-glycerol phosphate synthase